MAQNGKGKSAGEPTLDMVDDCLDNVRAKLDEIINQLNVVCPFAISQEKKGKSRNGKSKRSRAGAALAPGQKLEGLGGEGLLLVKL